MNDDVNGCIAMIDLCSSRCGFMHESNLISPVWQLHAACLRRHSDDKVTL